MTLDFTGFDFFTFDCYGTLINWEQGILGALRPILETHGVRKTDDEILATYGEIEPPLQNPYRRYREVLRQVVREFGIRNGFAASEDEIPAWRGLSRARLARRNAASSVRRFEFMSFISLPVPSGGWYCQSQARAVSPSRFARLLTSAAWLRQSP